MKKIILMLLLASVYTLSIAYGTPDLRNYNGLRIKFGWTAEQADRKYFYSVPRVIGEAEMYGWFRTPNPHNEVPDMKMYCFVNRAICALYDVGGFVAGLQIGIPKSSYQMPNEKLEYNFYLWTAPEIAEDPHRQYLTLTQFFVAPESLKVGAAPTVENGQTLQDNGVWVKDNIKGKLMRIPLNESEMQGSLFKKQNCVPNMGTHYYFNMTPAMSCEKSFPWFALYSGGDLIGTGLQFFGSLDENAFRWRNWFEIPPAAKQTAELIIPNGPKCMYDWAEKYQLLSVHIYYIKYPWYIKCRNGDSIKPGPVLDRLWFNGYRYVSQLVDKFKYIFSG